MNKLFSNFLFSILVTVVMNGLDIAYHLATSWAVHLNYVAIKLTVIFLTTFLITHFIGKGKEQGIVSSLFGPLMFYLYYVFAGPTLNRAIFKLDEQFWFIFLHLFFMLAAYFSVINFVKSRKDWLKKISFLVLSIFGAAAFDALFLMARFKFLGLDEETAASLMTFSLLSLPILAYFVSYLLLIVVFAEKKPWGNILGGLISAIIIFVSSQDILHSIFAFLIFNLVYYLINCCKLENHASILMKKSTWLVIGILSLIAGGFYEFVPRKAIKSISEFLIFNITVFGYRIRQNDIILAATILLIISFVSFYKFYKLNRSSKKK